jgi:hypothetical protein
VASEGAIRDLVRSRQPGLTTERAPETLRTWCNAAALQASEETAGRTDAGVPAKSSWFMPRLVAQMGVARLAVAAAFVVLVGGVVLYQATQYSARLLAVELTADHIKCFAANRLLGTRHPPAAVESSMMSAFGWRLHLPDQFDT